MSIESASLDTQRMAEYRRLSAAFSYPSEEFFKLFRNENSRRVSILRLYDRLFRGRSFWLYTSEYTAANEFERVRNLSEIMGFYRAFGLAPDRERADHLAVQFEFMHFLIFKTLYARHTLESEEKASVRVKAQSEFFNSYLYLGARRIAEELIESSEAGFYSEVSSEMVDFLREEKEYLRKRTK